MTTYNIKLEIKENNKTPNVTTKKVTTITSIYAAEYVMSKLWPLIQEKIKEEQLGTITPTTTPTKK